MERKCPSCGTWNADNDVCSSCGTLLDYWKIRVQDVEKKQVADAAKPPAQLDIFIDKWRYSKWLLIRLIFWLFYSIWMVIFGIITFFMMIIAWGPG